MELREDRMLQRLDAGQYTLNLVAALMASIWSGGALVLKAKTRMAMLLHQQSVELSAVSAVLLEYADSVGEGKGGGGGAGNAGAAAAVSGQIDDAEAQAEEVASIRLLAAVFDDGEAGGSS